MGRILEKPVVLIAALFIVLLPGASWAQQLQCRNWMTIIVPPETKISCERLFGDDWHVKSTRSGAGIRCSLCSPEDVITANSDLVTDPATLAEIARQGGLACAAVSQPVSEPWVFYKPSDPRSDTYWFAAGQKFFCHKDGFWWASSIYHWFDCTSGGKCTRNDYYDGAVTREVAKKNGHRRWEFTYTDGTIRHMGHNY